jgi:hypothetical protein
MGKINNIFGYFNLILFSILTSAYSASVNSAEIKEHTTFKHIIIEGKIQTGDYERLLNKILEKGISYRTIFLASAGGDATEAIKIGRMIRSLNYSTQTGLNFNGKNFCNKDIKPENCICASACPLIYLGGVHRYGDALAVHRIFLNHDALKNLSLEESKSLSKYLDIATEKYLTEMGAPSSLSEKISSATSDKIVFLEKDYVERNLYGYIKGYDEAMIAKCGSTDNAYKELRQKKSNEKEFARWENIVACQSNELRYEAERKYFEAIKSAIQNADEKYIPDGSLLQFLKRKSISDMAELLGMNATDGLKFLALFGIGDSHKRGKFKFKDEVILFNDSISVLFDTNSTIHSIDLKFFKSDKDDSHPYRGKFIGDFSFKSAPTEFTKVLGNPFKSGCVESSGVCMMWFDSKRFSANIGFESDRKTLRFIHIRKSGHYSKQ